MVTIRPGVFIYLKTAKHRSAATKTFYCLLSRPITEFTFYRTARRKRVIRNGYAQEDYVQILQFSIGEGEVSLDRSKDLYQCKFDAFIRNRIHSQRVVPSYLKFPTKHMLRTRSTIMFQVRSVCFLSANSVPQFNKRK